MSTTLKKRSTQELQSLVDEAASRLEGATAEQVATWAAENFSGSLAVACSMADAVLPHVIAQAAPGVDVLFLETGYHFAETKGTRDAVAEVMPVTVIDVMPELTVEQQDARHGEKLHDRDPALCCEMRKVAPLARQLEGYEAWVTGVRRDEAPTRADTPVVTFDERHGLVKINPLVDWTFDQMMQYAQDNGVLVNPLVQLGYPSIGCEPCTKAVAPGEDPRSGRWSGSAKTECGIHL